MPGRQSRFAALSGAVSGFVLGFSLFVVAATALPTIPSSRPLTIGAILSLTGGLEQWCSFIRQGIELAQLEPGAPAVQILVEDDRSLDRRAAATAAQKLLAVDRVDMLYSWTASTAQVLIPLAQKAKVPLLLGSFDRNVKEGGAYVFGYLINYDRLARDIADFLVTRHGAKRLALVMAQDDWSGGFAAPFTEQVTQGGATIAYSVTVTPQERDMRSIVARLREQKVDAVLAPLFGDSLYAFLRQRRELHYGGVVHVGDGMFEEDLKVAGESAEGIFSAQVWVESEELKRRYQAQNGALNSPLQLGLVAAGYDWVHHLRGAAREIVKDGEDLSPESLRRRLEQFRSTGFTGPLMFREPPETSGEKFMIVRGGAFHPVDEATE